MNASDTIKMLDPLVNRERLQRLEDRLTSGNAKGLPIASVTVGFESSSCVSKSSHNSNNSDSISKTAHSMDEKVASLNHGASAVPSQIPDSPPLSRNRADFKSIPEYNEDQGDENKNSLRFNTFCQNSLDTTKSRKRKLVPSTDNNAARKENIERSNINFTREDDTLIMHFAFFNRSTATWLELSEKLQLPVKDIKNRYHELVTEAAKIDAQDPRNCCSLDVTSRSSSISLGGLSQGSISISAEPVVSLSGNGDGPDQKKIDHNSMQRSTLKSGSEDSAPHSLNKPDSQRRKERSQSPMTSSNISLKNALKNQLRIKEFFVPVGSSLGGNVEKRKKLIDAAASSPTVATSTILESYSQTQQSTLGEVMPKTTAQNPKLPVACVLSPSFPRVDENRSDIDNPTHFNTFPNGDTKATTNEETNLLILKSEIREKDRALDGLQLQLQQNENELSKERQLIQVQSKELSELRSVNAELIQQKSTTSDKTAKVLEQLIRQVDSDLHRYQRQKLVEDGFRLGRVGVQKHGVGPRAKLVEIWEEGHDFKVLRNQQLDLLKRKEGVDKKKKVVLKAIKQRRAIQAGTSEDCALTVLDDAEATEAMAATMGTLKRMEQEHCEQHIRLEREKIFHIRAIKRMREEDQSRFNLQPVLNNRYLLRDLIGKGGFSEVWRGFDLIELRDVAVKVHELTQGWSEQRKASYLKHATREYQIHLSLSHHRIVQLYDVFEIDENSFATVLEYCNGTDLELHLKWRKTLTEREARAIILQILSGLRYLNSGVDMENGACSASTSEGSSLNQQQKRKPRIIHYDLKPGNILFDGEGGVKITDFGLSKIMDPGAPGESNNEGIELTSQGAGTYWYLPPECFKTDRVVHISSKVDVWSCGVILFQMIYGIRPFGEGLSQDKVMLNNTMLKATSVVFPPKPVVSEEAKLFIRRCLTHEQVLRPDVETICQDQYLSMNFSNRK